MINTVLENQIKEFTKEASRSQRSVSTIEPALIKLFNFPEIIPAYEHMLNFYFGDIRKDGTTPSSFHPLECAFLLNKYKCEPETIAAGLLHDIAEDPFKDKFKVTLNSIITKIINEEEIESEKSKLILLSNPKENEELYHIRHNLFESQSFANDVTNIVELVSDLFHLTKEPYTNYIDDIFRKDKVTETRYRTYIQYLIKNCAEQQDNRSLKVKLADRGNNTKSLYNVNATTIKNTLLKNNIFLEEFEKENNLPIDDCTFNLFRYLEHQIRETIKKPQVENLSPNQRKEFNQYAKESIRIIESIKRNYKLK
ncbi:HD domain-containing protein [Candidatus Woesearchaeota archaeon]|nr:HD domain-containing protein [Candidatus Woesearchaeota archaeon]